MRATDSALAEAVGTAAFFVLAFLLAVVWACTKALRDKRRERIAAEVARFDHLTARVGYNRDRESR